MKTRLLLLFSLIVVAAVFWIEPIPQDLAYHQFADGRSVFSIANFWNVMSNLPFLAVGAAGLWFLRTRQRQGIVDSLYPAYIVFFVGVLATGFGSSWYHLAPDNNTLVWDRLPMTIAFMALFAVVIGEYVCEQSGRRLLIPLLSVGALSVFYWQYTEAGGAGDLRPYALVQFLPIALIPVILLLYRPTFDLKWLYWGMIMLYAFSKLFEYFDYTVFDLGQILSGHTIKHVVAAGATAFFLYGVARRRISDTGLQEID